MGGSLAEKRSVLEEHLAEQEGIVIAFSGGVDSTYLAAIAHQVLGHRSLAVTAVSPSLARRELAELQRLVAERGWNHRLVQTYEHERDEYRANSGDRCYWCKTELFEVLGPLAEELGAPIAVGTNVDDLGDYRPGLKAASERGVQTPLVDAGFTKSDVRADSRSIGLPTSDKPASPCLASRFAYGVPVSPESLARIDDAEEFVRSFGFDEFRVRDMGDEARIQVPLPRVAEAAALRTRLEEGLLALGFPAVTIDPKGFRSGSMNDALLSPSFRAGA